MEETPEGTGSSSSTSNADQARPEPDVVQCSTSVPKAEEGEQTQTRFVGEQMVEMINLQTQRRLSQGDGPLWLDKAKEDTEDRRFLLERSRKKILMTEVAPEHSTLRDDERAGWKLPLEIFSSKKQVNIENKSRRSRSYYKAQDELITAYEDMSEDRENNLELGNTQSNYQRALMFSKITLLINLLLLIAKAVASALSGSMSIISSLVDSSLDLFSGTIMWWATRAVKQSNPYSYPQGRTKLEPVAVIILSVVMALCSLQLVRESVEKTIDLSGHHSSLPNVDYVTFIIAGSTVVVKFILWIVCRRVNSQVVQALAQDHRNDVLSNSVAIVCGYLGSKNFKGITGIYNFAYVDPIGAILISFYIMFNWWQTGSEQIKMLTGHTARPDFLSKITWICLNHHPKVKKIDTVRAFHFGSNFLVEVDIVLPDEMILKEAHNIGESLQHRLESLSEVERAFVHLDFDFTHNPESEHKLV